MDPVTSSSTSGVEVHLRAAWTTSYIDDLPDSSFLYVEPGGDKDGEGKTTPRSLRHFPYKDAAGNIDMPHLRNAAARIPQSGLPADVKASLANKVDRLLNSQNGRSRSVEFRALAGSSTLRDNGDGTMPTLVGTLAVFDEWTEIASRMEGNFLERIAPGAFTKTIRENGDKMRVLFNHGKDPSIGEKPLGTVRNLTVDERGVNYEVELFDTSYNRDLVPLLASDPPVLGSSFRFEVTREDRKRRPGKSDYNPRNLDERTVQEVRMSEFGPVTFPAYTSTKAGLRSMSDRFLLNDTLEEERLDAEDLNCLAKMLSLGACYIQEQDEPDEQQNVTKMEAILAAISELVPVEVAEDEPAEPDEMASADTRDTDEAGDVPADDAPSVSSAGAKDYLHPAEERRVGPHYLSGMKEKPSWHLQ